MENNNIVWEEKPKKKTDTETLDYKKQYYQENGDILKERVLNYYYVKKYGKSREEVVYDKAIKKQEMLQAQLARLQTKIAASAAAVNPSVN
jgi:hypothetical protein